MESSPHIEIGTFRLAWLRSKLAFKIIPVAAHIYSIYTSYINGLTSSFYWLLGSLVIGFILPVYVHFLWIQDDDKKGLSSMNNWDKIKRSALTWMFRYLYNFSKSLTIIKHLLDKY